MGEVALRERIEKSEGEVRATSVTIIFLVLCLSAFIGLFTYFLANIATQTKNQLEYEAVFAAQVVATNTFWMNEVASETLRRVDSLFPETGKEINSSELAQVITDRPTDMIVMLISADREIIFSTLDGAVGHVVSEREYFTELRDGAQYHTSKMGVPHDPRLPVFVLSKRIERNGEFAGVATVWFDRGVFDTLLREVNFREGMKLSLVRRDGNLIATYPTSDLDTQPVPVELSTHLDRQDLGTFFTVPTADAPEARIVGYRKVPSTDVVAVITLPTAVAWDRYRGEMISMFVIVSPICFALLVVGWWIWRLLSRDAAHTVELETANETNLMLFREIHHRVKNNLQSIQSLIRLQDIPLAAKTDLQSRLGAMAAMHEHIYRRDEYEDIDAHEIIPVIVNEVVHAYGKAVEIIYEIDRAYVDRDHITPLSLLLSELVTNALKYAFVDGKQGRIRITLRDHHNGRCLLTVADNGIGMTSEVAEKNSMGIRLVRGVVSQMAGTFEFVPGAGTRFEATLALSAVGHHTEHS